MQLAPARYGPPRLFHCLKPPQALASKAKLKTLFGAVSVVGQNISHYKIIEKIGQGGMVEVFLAHDTSLDRKVALKFLPEKLQQDSTARKRFLREAKSAAALDHPFICKIYEVGEAEENSFIAMESIQGAPSRRH